VRARPASFFLLLLVFCSAVDDGEEEDDTRAAISSVATSISAAKNPSSSSSSSPSRSRPTEEGKSIFPRGERSSENRFPSCPPPSFFAEKMRRVRIVDYGDNVDADGPGTASIYNLHHSHRRLPFTLFSVLSLSLPSLALSFVLWRS